MFLTFSPPFLHAGLFHVLKRKIFSKPFQSKISSNGAKGNRTCPRSVPTLECFRCSSPRALATKSEQQDVHAVCGGVDQRASHASGTAGNYLAEQNPSYNVMMWGLVCQHQLTDFFLILCPCLPISIPWGTILVAGRIQFSTDCTEA